MSGAISYANNKEGYAISLNRRDFLRLITVGGAVFSTGLAGMIAFAKSGKLEEFYFVQLSDTHLGFNNKKFNADPEGTLPKAIKLVNQLDPPSNQYR